MKKKKIVIALGHEALGTTLPEQKEATRRTAKAVADFIREDYQVVITHSNGPQIGMIHTAMNEFCRLYPEYTATPMSVCSAMSQGYIGYDLQNAIRAELLNKGIYKPVSTVLTQVVVDPYDEAFYKPSKVIGRVMSEEEAEVEEKKGNHVIKVEEGYRRIVAAPKPVDLDGEEIDCSGLVGSTVDTISASTPWGAIDTNKQITISGFRWDYMSWAAVKTTTSDQYRLRQHYYPNWSGEVPEAFDSNGFAKIGDRYVVAVTNIDQGGIGRTGQMLDVYLGDGSCIQCVVGDIKAQNSGEYWCTYGHFIGSSTQINVIEFVVSKEYTSRFINPREYIPSLNQGIIKIVRGDVVEY